MTGHTNANVGCLLVGEYIDEAEVPAEAVFHRGEVVRPQVVANHLDLWSREDSLRDFTVLLRDGREVAVRGQALKHLPASVNGESGSYGITVRNGDGEVFVALFKITEVVGVFNGEVRSDRKIA